MNTFAAVIGLFRTNRAIGAIFIGVYLALLHLPALAGWSKAPVAEYPSGGIYASLFSWTIEYPFWSAVIAMLLVYLQSLLINWIVNETRVTQERDWLPAMAYAFSASCIIDFQYVTPPLVTNTFLLLALRNMYHTYKSGPIIAEAFDVSFWMGVGALFYPPAIWLIIPLFLGILGLRVFRIREQAIFIVGFIVPGFLSWTWYFWNDKGIVFRHSYFDNLFSFCNFEWDNSTYQYLKISMLLLILLIIVFSSSTYFYKKLLQSRKYINGLFLMFFFSIALALVVDRPNAAHFILAAPSAGIFLGMTWQSIKRRLFAEIIHLLLIGVYIALLAYQGS